MKDIVAVAALALIVIGETWIIALLSLWLNEALDTLDRIES